MDKQQNNECRIGVRIVIEDGRSGVIRFLGPTKFKEGIWAGIELDSPLGRNDGKINGYRYFYCPPNHGVFVHPSKVSLACGGPNFGDIIESTPVKNPLTFPSFDQKIPSDKVNYEEYKPKQSAILSYRESNIHPDKEEDSLNEKIALLTSNVRRLEMENLRLQKKINESQKYTVLIRSLHKKCFGLKGKIKNLKEYFLELNNAKSKTEEFFESELTKIRREMEEKLRKVCKSEIPSYNDFKIEKNNMNLYLDWIFCLRRNKVSKGEISLPPTGINSKLVDLNNDSIKSLEKIYLNIRKLIESFSSLKKNYSKSSVIDGSNFKHRAIENEFIHS
jgi:hypothetical protein